MGRYGHSERFLPVIKPRLGTEEHRLDLGPMIEWMLRSTADEFFIGSSRGAAKTFGLLLLVVDRLRKLPHYRAVIFRRQFRMIERLLVPEIEKAIDTLHAHRLFRLTASSVIKLSCRSTKSELLLSAAETEDDAEGFQGGNFHFVGVDEAQQPLPTVLEKIPAIGRAGVGDYPVQKFWSANPNGPGHEWLKRRFIDPARALARNGNVRHDPPVYVHPITGETFRLDNHWRYEVEIPGTASRSVHEVVLAQTWMNPAIDYRTYLGTMTSDLKDNETLRRQWVCNDWDAVSGQFYPRLNNATRSCERLPYDRVLCAIDHGHRKTAAVWAAVDREGTYKFFDAAMYLNEEIGGGAGRVGKASKIATRHDGIDLYVMDPAARAVLEGSGARTIRRMYAEAGPLSPLVLCRSNDRRAGWEALRAGFADGTVLIDPVGCKLLIDSLKSLVSKASDSEDAEKQDGTEGQPDGDHLADAARYLVVNGFAAGEEEPSWEEQFTERVFREEPWVKELVEENDDRGGEKSWTR